LTDPLAMPWMKRRCILSELFDRIISEKRRLQPLRDCEEAKDGAFAYPDASPAKKNSAAREEFDKLLN
jgi:hypothetical protein